ncbi:winged helix DNA-binding domain-containing protein, partial [Agrocybe pediades]
LIKFAIWQSPHKRLTLSQIYDAIGDRWPFLNVPEDKPWQRSIRHSLSLKAMFVQVPRPLNEPGKGNYWVIDMRNGTGDSRARVR